MCASKPDTDSGEQLGQGWVGLACRMGGPYPAEEGALAKVAHYSLELGALASAYE